MGVRLVLITLLFITNALSALTKADLEEWNYLQDGISAPSDFEIQIRYEETVESQDEITWVFGLLNLQVDHSDENRIRISHQKNERIRGSLKDQVIGVSFTKNQYVSKSSFDVFLNDLLELGVRDLPNDWLPPKPLAASSIRLTLSMSDSVTYFYMPSYNQDHGKIHNRIKAFIYDNSLNELPERVALNIYFRDFRYSHKLALSIDEIIDLNWYHWKSILDFQITHESGSQDRYKMVVGSDNESRTIEGNIYMLEGAEFSAETMIGRRIDFMTSNPGIEITEGDHIEPIETTIQELIANVDHYHGKRVRVSGRFIDGFENQTFKDSEGNRLWMGMVSTFAEPNTRRIEGWATVEGVFIKGPSGHFGLWPGEIKRITKFDSHFSETLMDLLKYFSILIAIIASGLILFRLFYTKRMG